MANNNRMELIGFGCNQISNCLSIEQIVLESGTNSIKMRMMKKGIGAIHFCRGVNCVRACLYLCVGESSGRVVSVLCFNDFRLAIFFIFLPFFLSSFHYLILLHDMGDQSKNSSISVIYGQLECSWLWLSRLNELRQTPTVWSNLPHFNHARSHIDMPRKWCQLWLELDIGLNEQKYCFHNYSFKCKLITL